MTSKRSLIKLSASLLIFNLILGAFAIFTFLKANEKQDQTEARQETEVLGASTTPIFNRNRILSDTDFTTTRAFPDESAVQAYLDQVNSPLRNYTDGGRRASYWIFAAARGQTSSKWGIVPQLNPGVILSYLQKEQSLLTLSGYDTVNDPEFRIRAAMGYGCPDDASCDPAYKGFANQVNWAAYQLQLNFGQATTGGGGTPYRVNQTIATLDEYNVFITNSATAANYRYTPHVYWGNYNLWKIMTANGWGENSQTYSMGTIDEVNLPLKNQTLNVDPNERVIALSEVYALIIRNYSLGENSEDIRTLQTFLRQQGYFMSSDITGTFGVITQSALIAYRRDAGIILNQPSDVCVALLNKTYKVGSTTEEVKSLQQCLRDMGLFDFPTNTGYYGPITQEAQEKAKKAIEDLNRGGPASQTASCQELKNATWTMGETSERVKQLQECMRAAGTFNYIYGNTGYFGDVTQKALNDWRNTPTSSPASAAPVATCEDLKKATWAIGERSDRVKQLQDCMTTAGTFSWPYGSTGYFGDVTQKALDDWRSKDTVVITPTPSPSPGSRIGKSCADMKKRGWEVGSFSDDVKILQDCMTADGAFSWQYGSTGYFGDVTKAAFVNWRAQGSSCQDLKNAGWILGERNDQVVRLQNCMRSDGKFNWQYGSTGYFGEVTKQSLIDWRGYF